MDEYRANIVLLTQSSELGNVVLIERFDGPSAGISTEDLHGRAAKFVGSLDRQGKSA